jgi:hypothetical protein
MEGAYKCCCTLKSLCSTYLVWPLLSHINFVSKAQCHALKIKYNYITLKTSFSHLVVIQISSTMFKEFTSLGRPRRRWVDNNRMDLVEVGWDRWRALVNSVLNLQVP